MKTTIKKLNGVLILLSLFYGHIGESQVTVNSVVTPTDLVNYLIEGNVVISNITFTGDPRARGIFDGENSNIGFKHGIILATGLATNANGPNNDPVDGSCWVNDIRKSTDFGRPGDIDLNAIQGCSDCTNDASVLEFDFIPRSTPLYFKYVFSSEEYPCYVCSHFNDIFAFLLTGPDPAGGMYTEKNIAIIPGTNIPVEINSVNSGKPGLSPDSQSYYPSNDCKSLAYSQYYNNNGDGSTPSINTTVQYNGFTVPFEAKADVVPCQIYHIKLAIADVGDGKYDSGVFLESRQFKSGVVFHPKVAYSHPDIDTAAIEGCNDALVSFNIDEPSTLDYELRMEYSGTAKNGIDFEKLPESILLRAGQTSVSVVVSPLSDELKEGTETLMIKAWTSPCGCDSVKIIIKDYDGIKIDLGENDTICKGQLFKIIPEIKGGIKPYKFNWNTGNNTSDITVSPDVTMTYSATAVDVCGNSSGDNIEIVVNACDKHKITGKLKYDNSENSPLKNIKLYLYTFENDIKTDSVRTDSTGMYAFNNVFKGKYYIIPVINKLTGGIDPIDALFINLYYLKLYKFQDELLSNASDVSDDFKTNPIDALQVNKRYIRMISGFKAGDWLFDSEILTITGSDVEYNFRAVCFGDVNGSYKNL